MPTTPASRYFVGAFFVDSVGTGLFLAGAALFFTRAIGLSSAQVGVGLTLSGLCGLLCSVPFGRLADRFGSRRTIVALYVWRGLGFLAYLLIRDFAAFIVVACMLGAGEWTFAPIVQAMVAASDTGASRVRTMAAVNAVRNVGFALGALLATLAIASGSVTAYRGLVLVDGLSFFVAAVLLSRIAVAATQISPPRAVRRSRRVIRPGYLLLATGNGVLFAHTVLLTIGLPLWIVTRTHAPLPLVGAIVIVNTVLASSLGLALSRNAEGAAAGAARQHRAGWCLAACCALVAFSGDVGSAAACGLLIAAAAALTLGEVWQSVGSLGLSYALAPDHDRGYYLSVYRLGEPATVIVGPAVLTAGVLRAGSAGWLLLGGVFAVTGIAVRAVAAHGPSAIAADAPAQTRRDRDETTMRQEMQCAS